MKRRLGNNKEDIEKELAKIGIVPTTREKRLKDPLFSQVLWPHGNHESKKSNAKKDNEAR